MGDEQHLCQTCSSCARCCEVERSSIWQEQTSNRLGFRLLNVDSVYVCRCVEPGIQTLSVASCSVMDALFRTFSNLDDTVPTQQAVSLCAVWRLLVQHGDNTPLHRFAHELIEALPSVDCPCLSLLALE